MTFSQKHGQGRVEGKSNYVNAEAPIWFDISFDEANFSKVSIVNVSFSSATEKNLSKLRFKGVEISLMTKT